MAGSGRAPARAFDEAGGTDAIGAAPGWALSGAPLLEMLAAINGLVMLLIVLLNNVATALMAQIGIESGCGADSHFARRRFRPSHIARSLERYLDIFGRRGRGR